MTSHDPAQSQRNPRWVTVWALWLGGVAFAGLIERDGFPWSTLEMMGHLVAGMAIGLLLGGWVHRAD